MPSLDFPLLTILTHPPFRCCPILPRRRDKASLAWRSLASKADQELENWSEDRGSGQHDYFEEYVPPWALRGLLPSCLLDEYEFWRVGDDLIRGYAKAGGSAATQSLHVKLILDPFAAAKGRETPTVGGAAMSKRPGSGSARRLSLTQTRGSSSSSVLGCSSLENGGGRACFALVHRLTRTGGTDPSSHSVETLLNLHAAPRSSCLGRLAEVVAHLDNLSHALAWAAGDAGINDRASVALVELPRMQLRFRAEPGKLWSLDHDGCFVSDRAVVHNHTLLEHLRLFECSLVLENMQREIFILLPSYGVMRPTIRACPMSTALIFDRSHAGWRSHVKATHYKLQLHSSGAFLITPSLSAAMYLLAIRLFKRQYELAARLIPSVLSDVPFVGEESWVKALFGGLSDDPHPDAIALRLRIALQCADCSELPPFGGGGDERSCTTLDEVEGLRQHRFGVSRKAFDQYVHKWAAVSTTCRLTLAQEERLVSLLSHPRRRRFLDRLRKCEAKPEHGHHLTRFQVSLMEAKIGGNCFAELLRNTNATFLHKQVYEKFEAAIDPLESMRTQVGLPASLLERTPWLRPAELKFAAPPRASCPGGRWLKGRARLSLRAPSRGPSVRCRRLAMR